MRKTAPISLVLVAALGLAGCGSSDKNDTKASSSTSSYCDALKAARDDITKFTGNDIPTTAGFESFLEELDGLADKAPKAVTADWKTLQTLLGKLTDALKSSGITLEQIAEISKTNKLPEGVSATDVQALASTMQQLGGPEFDTAAKAIDKNAKSACGITISLS